VPTRDQLLDAWGNALGLLSGATHAAFVASECMQVRGRLVVQLQRPSQRIKYLWGGVAIPTLLKANVVVGAHTRQQRELVAAQPGNTSAADVRDPGTLGRDQLATGPEILAKRVAGLHPHTITPRDVRVALPLPRLRGPLATPPSAREPVGMTSITTPITTPFKFHSTAAEVLADVDLSGKRAIVTGAASGIGVETARALAGAGADVTLAVRNPQAGADIAAEITASTGNPAVHAAQLELTNPSSIYRFVGSWRGPLHILVNNAGVMASPEAYTDDGWESQFATNHLGLAGADRVNEVVSLLDRREDLLGARAEHLAQRRVEVTAGAPGDLRARPGNTTECVRDRRLLSDPDNPGDRVQRLAGTPVRESTPVPTLKHIAERLHHDGRETQLSPKRDGHLARRAHRDRTNSRCHREEPLHRRRAHDRLERRQLRACERLVTGIERHQEALKRDVVAEQYGVLARMPATDSPHQRR